MRVKKEYAKPLEEGRLLILSPFQPKERRVTTELSHLRNRFVAALADEIFISHAAPGGKIEAFCREIAAWGKPMETLETPANAVIIGYGAKAVSPSER